MPNPFIRLSENTNININIITAQTSMKHTHNRRTYFKMDTQHCFKIKLLFIQKKNITQYDDDLLMGFSDSATW